MSVGAETAHRQTNRPLCRVLIFNYEVPCGGTDPPPFKQVIQVGLPAHFLCSSPNPVPYCWLHHFDVQPSQCMAAAVGVISNLCGQCTHVNGTC